MSDLPASALKFYGVTMRCGDWRKALLINESNRAVALKKAFPFLVDDAEFKRIELKEIHLTIEERVFLPNLE